MTIVYHTRRLRHSQNVDLKAQRALQHTQSILKARRNSTHYRQHIASKLAVPIPIHRLPAELLLAIFGLATDPSADSLDQTQGLWLFSHVCSSWRQLVLAMPYLWSRIRIHPTPMALSAKPMINRVQALQIFLSRSHNLPISIELTLQGDSELPLLHTLMDHSMRWRVFKARMPAIFYLDLSPIKYALPLLEHVSLELPHIFSSRVSTGIRIDAFSHAPVLHLVDMPNWHFDLERSLDLPWEQVHRFTSRCAAGLTGILERMVNVEEIDIEGFLFDSYTSEDSSVEAGVREISLPSLRRLRTRIDCAPIFKRCHIPNLEELALTHTRYTNECPLLAHLSVDDGKVTPQLPMLRRIYISHLTTGLANSLLTFLLSPAGAGVEKLAFGTWAVSGLEKVLTSLAPPLSGCYPSSNLYCAQKVLPDLRAMELGGNLMEGGILCRLGEVRRRLTVKVKWFHGYPHDISSLLPRLHLDIQD